MFSNSLGACSNCGLADCGCYNELSGWQDGPKDKRWNKKPWGAVLNALSKIMTDARLDKWVTKKSYGAFYHNDWYRKQTNGVLIKWIQASVHHEGYRFEMITLLMPPEFEEVVQKAYKKEVMNELEAAILQKGINKILKVAKNGHASKEERNILKLLDIPDPTPAPKKKRPPRLTPAQLRQKKRLEAAKAAKIKQMKQRQEAQAAAIAKQKASAKQQQPGTTKRGGGTAKRGGPPQFVSQPGTTKRQPPQITSKPARLVPKAESGFKPVSKPTLTLAGIIFKVRTKEALTPQEDVILQKEIDRVLTKAKNHTATAKEERFLAYVGIPNPAYAYAKTKDGKFLFITAREYAKLDQVSKKNFAKKASTGHRYGGLATKYYPINRPGKAAAGAVISARGKKKYVKAQRKDVLEMRKKMKEQRRSKEKQMAEDIINHVISRPDRISVAVYKRLPRVFQLAYKFIRKGHAVRFKNKPGRYALSTDSYVLATSTVNKPNMHLTSNKSVTVTSRGTTTTTSPTKKASITNAQYLNLHPLEQAQFTKKTLFMGTRTAPRIVIKWISKTSDGDRIVAKLKGKKVNMHITPFEQTVLAAKKQEQSALPMDVKLQEEKQRVTVTNGRNKITQEAILTSMAPLDPTQLQKVPPSLTPMTAVGSQVPGEIYVKEEEEKTGLPLPLPYLIGGGVAVLLVLMKFLGGGRRQRVVYVPAPAA